MVRHPAISPVSHCFLLWDRSITPQRHRPVGLDRPAMAEEDSPASLQVFTSEAGRIHTTHDTRHTLNLSVFGCQDRTDYVYIISQNGAVYLKRQQRHIRGKLQGRREIFTSHQTARIGISRFHHADHIAFGKNAQLSEPLLELHRRMRIPSTKEWRRT